jgi:hypothetical protein
MELVRVTENSIPPFDREILNKELHSEKVGEVWED